MMAGSSFGVVTDASTAFRAIIESVMLYDRPYIFCKQVNVM